VPYDRSNFFFILLVMVLGASRDYTINYILSIKIGLLRNIIIDHDIDDDDEIIWNGFQRVYIILLARVRWLDRLYTVINKLLPLHAENGFDIYQYLRTYDSLLSEG